MSSDLLILAACLGIGQAFAALPFVRRALSRAVPSVFGRALFGCALGAACYVGGTKAPVASLSYAAQFVTVLRGGMVIDESGVIAKATEQAVIESFVDYATEIMDAASNTVEQAGADFAAAAGLVTNSERRVIYVSSYLPRSGTGQGAVTNHNIAATLEQTRMIDGTNFIAWVWFSEEPAFAPGLSAEIDVGGGPVRVACLTNHYPETETVNGAACVRYVFEIPEGARGVQFLPSYEVGFGSAGVPLLVPAGGITVETDGGTALPFSGTDAHFGGRLAVRYKGGIAVGASIDGTAVTNGVYHL